jgi:hypothetical protein
VVIITQATENTLTSGHYFCGTYNLLLLHLLLASKSWTHDKVNRHLHWYQKFFFKKNNEWFSTCSTAHYPLLWASPLFSIGCEALLCLFTSLSKRAKIVPNQYVLTFRRPILTCRVTLVSTVGDDLRLSSLLFRKSLKFPSLFFGYAKLSWTFTVLTILVSVPIFVTTVA